MCVQYVFSGHPYLESTTVLSDILYTLVKAYNLYEIMHIFYFLVVFLSLLVQNSLVALCATVLALAFYFGVSACAGGTLHDLYFGLTVVAVIILGSTANLATLLNTISVERDWIVVISDKNKNSLAGDALLFMHSTK